MVLPEARHQLAQHVRHLAVGLITNDQFDYATIEFLAGQATQDRGLNQVYSEAWCLYDDLWSYKLRGRNSLSKPLRHDVARWIMFLYYCG